MYKPETNDVVMDGTKDVAVIRDISQGSHTKYLRTQRLSKNDETGLAESLVPCRGFCSTPLHDIGDTSLERLITSLRFLSTHWTQSGSTGSMDP